jgi:hypothetical protein
MQKPTFICEHLPSKDWPNLIVAWEPWDRLAGVIMKCLQEGGETTTVKLCPECALEVGKAIAAHPAPEGLTPFFPGT